MKIPAIVGQAASVAFTAVVFTAAGNLTKRLIDYVDEQTGTKKKQEEKTTEPEVTEDLLS